MNDDPKTESLEVDGRYRRIVESTPEGIWIVDEDLRTTFANLAMATMLDTTVDDLIGSSVFDWMADEERRIAEASFHRRWDGIDERLEFTFTSALGRPVYTLVSSTLIERGDARPSEAIALVTDVSELRAAERALRVSEERFRALVQHSSDLVLVLDAQGAINYASPSVERALGHPQANVLGKRMTDLIEARSPAWLTATLDGRDPTDAEVLGHAEVLLSHANGSTRAFELRFTDLLDDPAVAGIVVNGRDVTDGKRFEIELQHQALHDAVTGLPNRVLLTDRLRQAIHRARREDRTLTVMLMDIDNFKVINDSMGREAGDQLLAGVSERLFRVVPSGDSLARFGDDEFVVVCEGLSGSEAGVLAHRLLATILEPISLMGRTVVVTATLGMVNAEMAGHSAPTAERILRDANACMYWAREKGHVGVVVFGDHMRGRAEDRLDLEQDLRLALERSELWCAYQPIVSLIDGTVVGLEALARWTSPSRGLMPPASFIPIAETSGLIVPLGEHVLREACRQVARWQPHGRQLTVAVNVSPSQLLDDAFPEIVATVLTETGLDPGALHLEITETALMGDVSTAIRQVGRLHELGVRIAIDDFGTGWSSLGQITKLAPDCLKVDKSFVDGLGQDEDARTVVASIISLARALGVQLIAEGVETERQIAELRALGCELAQGFHFSRPLPATEIQTWLRASGRDVGSTTVLALLEHHELHG